MRLLVVGKLNGQLSTAVKMAMSAGAKVSHVETIAAATHALRAGQGADLMMVDYELDIAALMAAVADDNRPMVVRDPGMQAVIAMADQIAPSDASILITGESGVGKEVIARYVHQKSRRASKP